MGRQHTAADARRAVEEARRAGFAGLNLDVSLGRPGETRECHDRFATYCRAAQSIASWPSRAAVG